VLAVLEQLLKTVDMNVLQTFPQNLPGNSSVAMLLDDLGLQLAAGPSPGDVLRLEIPGSGHSGVDDEFRGGLSPIRTSSGRPVLPPPSLPPPLPALAASFSNGQRKQVPEGQIPSPHHNHRPTSVVELPIGQVSGQRWGTTLVAQRGQQAAAIALAEQPSLMDALFLGNSMPLDIAGGSRPGCSTVGSGRGVENLEQESNGGGESPRGLPPTLGSAGMPEAAGGGGWLELRVPPDCGNGRWNGGVSLARLLWAVPPPALASLLAALLLERRVVLVSSAADTLTTAVQAAAALLYPFRWVGGCGTLELMCACMRAQLNVQSSLMPFGFGDGVEKIGTPCELVCRA
jgi:hypothetical protein